MGNCQNFNVQNDPIQTVKMRNKQQYQMSIKAYTWARDSHGLFDYESKNITKKVIKVQHEGTILRHKEEVFIQKDQPQDTEETKLLGEVELQDGEFYFNTAQQLKSKKKMKKRIEGVGEHCIWTIVKSLKQPNGAKGYLVKKGDYLKLGRVRFRVKDITDVQGNNNFQQEAQQFKFNPSNDQDVLDNDVNHQIDPNLIKDLPEEEITCRICLSEDELGNPLVTACKCDGTMGFIHINCLQKWLKNKLHPKITDNSISFVWKVFDCELCKQPFPNQIKVKGVSYDTIEIPTPEPPYITLEILSKDQNKCRGIHVITFSKKEAIKLGRGHDADIRIADISVSRCHAQLRYDKGKILLEDNNSKFGTLSLVRDSLPINLDTDNVAVQVGRSVLNFNLKKNWKVLSVCFGGPVIETQKVDQFNMAKKPIKPQQEEEKSEQDNSFRSQQLENNQQLIQQQLQIEQQIKYEQLQQQNQQQQQQQQISNRAQMNSLRQNNQQQQLSGQRNNREQIISHQRPLNQNNIEDEEDEDNLLINNQNQEEDPLDEEEQEMLNNPNHEQQDIIEEPEPQQEGEEEQDNQQQQQQNQQQNQQIQQPQQLVFEEEQKNQQENNNIQQQQLQLNSQSQILITSENEIQNKGDNIQQFQKNNNVQYQQQQQQQQQSQQQQQQSDNTLIQQGNAFINFQEENLLQPPSLQHQTTSIGQSNITQNSLQQASVQAQHSSISQEGGSLLNYQQQSFQDSQQKNNSNNNNNK